MAAWVCNQCTTVYSVGAPRCPQCGADDWVEEGSEPSPGTSSAPSSLKPEPTPSGSGQPDQSPAPTTGNPSRKARAANSSASGMDGGPAQVGDTTPSTPA